MEYKCKVQYLESTGTQYIDTGVKPDLANGDEVEISCYKVTGTGSQCIFGSRQTPALNGFYALGAAFVSCDDSGSIGEPFMGTGSLVIHLDDKHIELGEVEYSQYKRVTCAYNTYLFALNNGGSATAFYSGIKIYDWKYYHNGILAQHLIPVLDNNNVPCLYDTISGQLFYNKGTGQFLYGAVLGPVISAIPFLMRPLGRTCVRKLQYLESTGTQYIDTGYMIPDHGSGSIYIDFGTPNELNAVVYYFGAYYYGEAATLLSQSYIQNTPYQVTMGKWDGTDTKSHSGVLGARDHLKIDYQYGSEANTWSVTWSDGTTSTDTTDRTYHGSNLLLFRVQNTTSSAVPAKIYGFKVWENGSAVRDMIPVLDKSGVPCMFDNVTRKLFYNAGTGTFNYA